MARSKGALPPILEKAGTDQWYYLVETTAGRQLICGLIERHGDWIHLRPIDEGVGEGGTLTFNGPEANNAFEIRERGIDLRLEAVAWIADGKS